jgi:hypothetical protein
MAKNTTITKFNHVGTHVLACLHMLQKNPELQQKHIIPWSTLPLAMRPNQQHAKLPA